MADKIQKAYKALQKQQYLKTLPIILCGKDDEDELTEEIHFDDSDEALAHRKAQVDDVIKDHEYALSKAMILSSTDEEHHHIKKIGETIKRIKDLPTSDDIHDLNRSAQNLSYHAKWEVFKHIIRPLTRTVHLDPSVKNDSLYVHPGELKETINRGLSPVVGRVSKYPSFGSHLINHDGEYKPIDPDRHEYLLPQNGPDHPIDFEVKEELEKRHGEDLKNNIPSIKHYTDDSKEINKSLADQHLGTDSSNEYWRYTPAENLIMADNVSKAISKAKPISKSFDVFTGLSKSSNVFQRTQSGTTDVKFHAPTFLSTSLNFNEANEFAKAKGANRQNELEHYDGVGDVLHITIPAGFKGGAYVDPHSSNKGEFEYLLDKGHTFTIHKEPKYAVRNGKVNRVWRATIHPKEE